MKISKHIHSCVLVENEGERLLFDPGSFSFVENKVSAEEFIGITGILITHKHSDHYDASALEVILKNNPQTRIYTNLETKEVLPQFADRIEILETGERTIGKFKVKAFPAEHGRMFVPTPTNTVFVVNDEFMHTGDSLDPVIFQHKCKIIALPVAAPWLTMVEAWEFAQEFKPEIVMPVHDGYVKDFFNQSMYKMWEKMLSEKGIKFSGYGSIG